MGWIKCLMACRNQIMPPSHNRETPCDQKTHVYEQVLLPCPFAPMASVSLSFLNSYSVLAGQTLAVVHVWIHSCWLCLTLAMQETTLPLSDGLHPSLLQSLCTDLELDLEGHLISCVWRKLHCSCHSCKNKRLTSPWVQLPSIPPETPVPSWVWSTLGMPL